MSQRPSWDDTWSEVAKVLARRSTCLRASVGAVLVSPDHRLIAAGYNGAPAGQPHCQDEGCIIGPYGTCVRAVHAEANAIFQAREKAEGSILYVTMSPCFSCAGLIVNARIRKVAYSQRYHPVNGIPDPVDFLKSCGVEVQRV